MSENSYPIINILINSLRSKEMLEDFQYFPTLVILSLTELHTQIHSFDGLCFIYSNIPTSFGMESSNRSNLLAFQAVRMFLRVSRSCCFLSLIWSTCSICPACASCIWCIWCCICTWLWSGASLPPPGSAIIMAGMVNLEI